MIGWWLVDWWLMIDWLFIDDWLTIDLLFVDNWLMTDWLIMGWPYHSFDGVLLYWIVQLNFQILLKEFGTDCLGLVHFFVWKLCWCQDQQYMRSVLLFSQVKNIVLNYLQIPNPVSMFGGNRFPFNIPILKCWELRLLLLFPAPKFGKSLGQI